MAHQPLGGKPVGVVAPNSHLPGPLEDTEASQKDCSSQRETDLVLQIGEIAAEYGKSPAQVILSWAVQRGTSVIPKTVNEDRLKQNLHLFRLSSDHFDRINSLSEEKGTVRFLVPTGHIGFDIFDESCDQPLAVENYSGM